jgi:FKBP-type peptidyl-prolyl cis-trans isomerase SlyD
MRVKTGRVVLLDYMVRVETGQVVESSSGKAPIEYLHGAGQILPALERALEGLREGEQAAFSISAEDAYGERKDDNVVSLPRTLFPDDVKLEQGLCLYARASGGQSYPITVREVKEDMVVVDLNHPLAGERLFFEVNIRGVRPAGNQELFAGKAASMEVV